MRLSLARQSKCLRISCIRIPFSHPALEKKEGTKLTKNKKVERWKWKQAKEQQTKKGLIIVQQCWLSSLGIVRT